MPRLLNRHVFIFIAMVLTNGLSGQESLRSQLTKALSLRQQDVQASTTLAETVYTQARALHNDSCATEALFIKGWNLQGEGKYALSNTVFNQLLTEVGKDYPVQRLGYVYGRVGKNYSETGKYPQAMQYLLAYDSIAQSINTALKTQGAGAGNALIEPKLLLGELYEYMNRPKEANDYYEQAYDLAQDRGGRLQKMMALYYLLDFNIVRQKHPAGYEKQLAEYLENMQMMREDGSIDLSHAQLMLIGIPPTERIELLQQMRSDYKYLLSKYYATENLVKAYLELGKPGRALDVAEEDFATYKKSGNVPVILSMHKILADLDEQSGRYDNANTHLKNLIHLRDSVSNVRIEQSVDSLNILYQTAQKEEQLRSQELALTQEKAKRRALMFGLGGVLWFGAFLVLFFWNKNRLTKRIAAQEAAIQTQRIQQLQQEKRLLAMSSMIEGQEAERKRIAQDLHDGLGGLLSTVKAQLEVVQRQVTRIEQDEMYRKASAMIDNASNELRRITYNMMPSALTKLGLHAAIEDLADRLHTDHGIEVELQFLGANGRLGETNEIMLYRVVQELCNNVVKHAQAHHILIQINHTSKEVFLMVEDDGSGFDLEEIRERRSVGLKSIESRTRFMHGEFDITSTPGEGTCATIQIPLNGSNHELTGYP